MKKRPGCGCGCIALLAAVCLASAAAVFFHAWLFTGLGGYLVYNQAPARADAVVVLAGDDFGMRIVTAGKLVREGYAPYTLVDCVPNPIYDVPGSLIRYAGRRGYAASLFRPLSLQADSTRQETEVLAQTLKQRGVRKILLVTSNYHTRRARSLMRQAAPWLEVRTVAAPDKYFTTDGWWKTRGGQRTFFYEWAKTVSTWVGN